LSASSAANPGGLPEQLQPSHQSGQSPQTQQQQQQHISGGALQHPSERSDSAERVEEWMSGHESVTTQAEARQDPSPVAAVAGDPVAAWQHQQQPPKRVLRERRWAAGKQQRAA
jgi:hypothetical protein